MRVNFLNAYDRSFKRLSRIRQGKTIKAIDNLLEVIKTGRKPQGLGLKKARRDYWEIRIDINCRILFEFKADAINIAFVGDHNGIKQFLKRAK